MKETRVTDLAYRGLAYLFSPPGVRLVQKSEATSPTTSVLVRGAAGTGKTTLGLALAHALAKATGGIAVYVATEASLADAVHKASVLGLGGSAVVEYDARAPLPAGAVAVRHLVVERGEAVDAAPSRLASMAVDLAYELASSREAKAPVRAVVVDSLELPEAGAEEISRSTLAAFVQALESLGVNPVFVEEVGPSTSERLTFVVDIVLQLTLAPDPGTGTLRRKVAVLKSRYSEAVPGPHEMVMDDGAPAVWPDSPAVDFGTTRPPVGLVVPQPGKGSEKTLLAINRGALVLSRYDVDHLRVLRGVRSTPGVRWAQVSSGPVIRIQDHGEAVVREVPAAFGPQALAWGLHTALRSGRANAVGFARLEHLLAQARFARAIPRLLATLVRRGFLVCVHGTAKGLELIDELADYTGPTGHYEMADERAAVTRRYRAASAWRAGVPGLEGLPVRDAAHHAGLESAIASAREKLAEGDLEGARDALAADSPSTDPAVQRLKVEAALLLDHLGQTAAAQDRLDAVKNKSEDAVVRCAVAWAYVEIGAEWEALRMAFEGVDHPAPPQAMTLLWRSAFLRYSRTRASVPAEAWSAPIQARYVAQALAGREYLSIADEILERAARRPELPARRLARLAADVRLESWNEDAWREADARYVQCEADEGLDVAERADITFNRAVICERLGRCEEAIALYGRARESNPLLEAASARLAALG